MCMVFIEILRFHCFCVCISFPRALMANLGGPYRNGAGVLDIQFENPNILFSCGYDTMVRMWDLRYSHDKWYVPPARGYV